MLRFCTLVISLWFFLGAVAKAAEPLAVFDMEFVNFSQEMDYGYTNEIENARIKMLSGYLKELLRDSGKYEVVDTSEVAEKIASIRGVFSCNMCEDKMARQVGAKTSVTGAVQKLSVLVQTIILRQRDAQTGEVIGLYQTDIRGNTDLAWKRGLEWLVAHRLMAE